jgi:hypothetical protein
MKTYWGVDVQIHAFLTSALGGGEWSDSRPGRFNLGERAPRTDSIGGWVGTRAGLDAVTGRKKIPIIDPAGKWTPVFHPLPCLYADWANPAQSQSVTSINVSALVL